MDIDKYYTDYGLSPVDKKFKDQQEIHNVYKKPKKDKRIDIPRFYNFEKNNSHQMDILYMPEDGGYKYCLVVVDVGSKTVDAEPLKEVNPNSVLKGLQTIYKRKIIEWPKKVIVDSGKEFMGTFEQYIKDHHMSLKRALTGRHRQVGIVEKYNGIIGKQLFMRMASQEMLTGKPSTEWIKDLPNLIKSMNKKFSKPPLNTQQLLKISNPQRDLKQDIIPLNTLVRVKLDEPKNITGEKLHGKFRATDHRWSIEQYHIKNILFDPIEPVMYELDQKLKPHQKVAYTRNQLQIVNPKEEDPPYDKVVRTKNKDNMYIIKNILDHRKNRGQDQYLIWWKGFPKSESSWVSKKEIPKSVLENFNHQNQS